jgi:hypothetical protein
VQGAHTDRHTRAGSSRNIHTQRQKHSLTQKQTDRHTHTQTHTSTRRFAQTPAHAHIDLHGTYTKAGTGAHAHTRTPQCPVWTRRGAHTPWAYGRSSSMVCMLPLRKTVTGPVAAAARARCRSRCASTSGSRGGSWYMRACGVGAAATCVPCAHVAVVRTVSPHHA